MPVNLSTGSGSDRLILNISQDAFNGPAKYTVKVDGKQVGGTFAASALHIAKQFDTLTVYGDWAPGAHKVEVAFLNDLWNGTAATDRNLYVESVAYNGAALPGAATALMSAGSMMFTFSEAAPMLSYAPISLTAGSGPDELVLQIAQDAYQGSARYTVKIDGVQVGSVLTASALKNVGQADTLILRGDWAPSAHKVEVTFLNDLWNGTAATDRNLYIESVAYNGAAVPGAATALMSAGSKSFTFSEAAPVPVPIPVPASSEDTLSIYLAGDAWNGNAKATITVNGAAVGAVFDVGAVHAKDDVTAFTVKGNFGASPIVALSFINDASDGTRANDRNLFLGGFEYNGIEQLGIKETVGWNRTLQYTLSENPTNAIRAADLSGSLGACVHLDYLDTTYGLADGSGPNMPLILSSLGYLGVQNLRIGVPTAETLPAIKMLAAVGYTFNVLMPSASSDAMLKGQLAAIHPIATSVVSIEGPNEVNLTNDFSWSGQNGNAAARAYQHALYAAVKADLNFAGVEVYGLTLAGVGETAYETFGNMSADVDMGNMHVYFMNGLAPASTLRYVANLSSINAPGKPMAITETNYTSAPGIKGSVSEAVQAKYDLDLVMDAIQSGVPALYFYELLDEHLDPGQTNNENHYGLFRADGSPKPAATALHNLTTILADNAPNAATFETGTMRYDVSGLPLSGNTMLFEKASGEYDIVVWAEPELWDVETQTEVAATARPVTVTFESKQANIAVYDPMIGTAPMATYADAVAITLSVIDHPLVVEVWA